MFSPPNSPAVTDWFQRLDAAWRRMPAEERKIQREEVQQHLEGLVAEKVAQGQTTEAAWNAALSQFGDPTQIGRKVYQEWRQSITGFRADIAAILLGIGLYLLQFAGTEAFFLLLTSKLATAHGPIAVLLTVHNYQLNEVMRVSSDSSIILIYAIIGRKYPFQAIKGAFYTCIVCNLWDFPLSILSVSEHNVLSPTTPFAMLTHFMSVMPLLLSILVTVAYLASVTRRGWYRPSWADFKITLPQRRRQVG